MCNENDNNSEYHELDELFANLPDDFGDTDFTDDHVDMTLPTVDGYVIDAKGSHVREDAAHVERSGDGWLVSVHISEIEYHNRLKIQEILHLLNKPNPEGHNNVLMTQRYQRLAYRKSCKKISA